MKKLLILFAFIFLISFVSAETAFFISKNTESNITFVCKDDSQLNGLCSTSTTCNITIRYPNSSVLVVNRVATNNNNGEFSYKLNDTQTNPSGEYKTTVGCSSGGLNKSSTFIYEVNPAGIRSSDQRTEALTRTIYFMFGISLIFFIAFLFVGKDKESFDKDGNQFSESGNTPVKWTFFFIALLFFLITLNLLSLGLQDEVVNPKLETFLDSLSGTFFYLYWFIAGLLAIIWILTFLQTWIYRKNIENIQRFGGA